MENFSGAFVEGVVTLQNLGHTAVPSNVLGATVELFFLRTHLTKTLSGCKYYAFDALCTVIVNIFFIQNSGKLYDVLELSLIGFYDRQLTTGVTSNTSVYQKIIPG